MSQTANTTWWEKWHVNVSVSVLLAGAVSLGAAIYWQRDREDKALEKAQAYVREYVSERYPTRSEVSEWRREDLREMNASLQEVLRELRRR
jgi:hypothetical protein